MDIETLQRELDTRDDGLLRSGSHQAGGREFCALEFESQVRGREWSDAPLTLPDLRPLNDARWSSNAARTAALLPVMVALWDWSLWDDARRQRWAARVAIETVRQIVAELPSLSDDVRAECRAVVTLNDAQKAAEAAKAAAAEAANAAAWAAAWAAAEAARAAKAAEAAEAAKAAAAEAARAARAAGTAAAWAARTAADTMLQRACRIWIDAASEASDGR